MKLTKDEAKNQIINVLAKIGNILNFSMNITIKGNENITLIKATYNTTKSLEIGFTYFEREKIYEVQTVIFEGDISTENSIKIREIIEKELICYRRAVWKGV